MRVSRSRRVRRSTTVPEDLGALADAHGRSLVERHLSESTCRARARGVEWFVRFLTSRRRRRPQKIRFDDIEEFRRSLVQRSAQTGRRRGQPIHPNTVELYLSAVRGFTKWLVREGHILVDPAIDLVPMRVCRSLPRVLTLEQVEALLSTVAGDDPVAIRDCAILEVLYSSGLRRSELVALDVSDLDLLGGEVTIRRGKGGYWRRVPLGAHAAAALEVYLRAARDVLSLPLPIVDPQAVFLSRHGTRLSAPLVCLMVSKRARHAGIPFPVTPHTLRHTAGVHLLKGGADVRHIQELLGHTTLTMTAHYTRLVLDDLKEALARCHPRDRLKV